MRLALFIAAIVANWAAWGIAANAHRPQVQRADYQRCVTIHNGPIERPDHYGLPFQRKKDIA